MKKKLIVTLMAMALLLACGEAYAKRTAIIEETADQRVFVVSEEIARIPDVPKGIDDQTADDLFTGKIGSTLVEDVSGHITGSFSFPLLSLGRIHEDRLVTYKNGRFDPHSLPARVLSTETSKIVGTFTFTILPLLFIVLLSAAYSGTNWELGWLVLVHVMMVMVCLIGFRAPPTFDGFLQYLLFLLGVCVNSFLLAWGGQVFKEARRDWREAFQGPKKTKTITTRGDNQIEVDISDEAIAELCKQKRINPPLKYNQRCEFGNDWGHGVIEGVGPIRTNETGHNVLWITLDCDKGRSSFFSPLDPGDILSR